MTRPDWKYLQEVAAAWLYPRRCPLCGALLKSNAVQGTLCPDCLPESNRLSHLPPRLPATEHSFYAVSSAAAAYYYSGTVRTAILLCKRGGELWRARELADRMAIQIWGALPAQRVGARPVLAALAAFPTYHCIVPVPAREPLPGAPGLPLLLAKRLSVLFGIPVCTPLYTVRKLQPQKELNRAERIANKRNAYACRPGTDLAGKRVLLVDDIITTGATVSACAMALLQAGAFEVTAAAIAASEEMPKTEKQE